MAVTGKAGKTKNKGISKVYFLSWSFFVQKGIGKGEET